MAKKFSEAGIERGKIVQDEHILQLTDALRGDEGFEVRLTGSIFINDFLMPSASTTQSGHAMIITDYSAGTASLGFDYPTASFVTSSNVHGPDGPGSIESSSFASTASVAITALNVDFEDIVSIDYSASPSLFTVPVTHLFNSTDVVVQVYSVADDDPTQFVQIIPNEIRIIDNNTVNVTLNPTSNNGKIVVGQSGFLAAGSIQNAVTASYALNAANTAGFSTSFTSVSSLTVTHGLGNKYVDVTVYDTDDQIIIPRNVTALNTNRVNVQFAGPTSGVLVVK